MFTDKDYYTAPSQEIFEEIKAKSIELWRTYDDKYGYATQKVDRIKNVQNFKDNVWYIVGMFDQHNQAKLVTMLEGEARKLLVEMLQWHYQQVFNDL